MSTGSNINDFSGLKKIAFTFKAGIKEILSWIDKGLRACYIKYSLANLVTLPKTHLEEYLDILEEDIHCFNQEIAFLNQPPDTEKLLPNYFTLGLSKLAKETIINIISYFTVKELKIIHRMPIVSHLLRTRPYIEELMNRLIEQGLKKSFFYHINPALIGADREYISNVKKLLSEGYPEIWFQKIDPSRLIKAPVIKDPCFQDEEQTLSTRHFPEEHRIIRGTFNTSNNPIPFIGIKNKNDIPITIYKYLAPLGTSWRVCRNVETNTYNQGELSPLGPFSNEKMLFDLEKFDTVYETTYDKTGTHQLKRSFKKWQEWLMLFLSYINASCLQKDDKPCSLEVLSQLTEKLNEFVNCEEQLRFVDKTEYPTVFPEHSVSLAP